MPTGCEPTEAPDEAKGIFVDAQAPAGGDGTRAAPFASLYAAVTAAAGRPGASIYLLQGDTSYDLGDPLSLPALAQGLVLDGGWGGDWVRDCSAEAPTKTLVRGVSESVSPVLKAEGGQLTLRRLTVQTIGQSPPPQTKEQSGTSLVALHVADGTGLLLEAAVLRAGNAGDGAPAPSPDTASGQRACNGLTDCDDGSSVTTPGTVGGTDVAKFASAVFSPGNGQDGGNGPDGKNGTRTAASNGFEDPLCKACSGDSESACEAPGNLPVQSDTTSADGKCGCGGKGGAPGRGGKGGGASVALWVGGPAANINVVGSQLVSGNGGAGTPGGEGASGTNGVDGTSGAKFCDLPERGSVCSWSNAGSVCVPSPSTPTPSDTIGIAGSRGGNAGPGGKGGPGTGGPSYALVSPAAAAVQVDGSSSLIAGQGGLSGDGASRAEGAPQKTY